MAIRFEEWLAESGQWARVQPSQKVPNSLANGILSVVFQPIVDLHDGTAIGYETFVRSSAEAFMGAADMVDSAAKSGFAGPLGAAVRTLACHALPKERLFFNVHTSELKEDLLRPEDPLWNHAGGVTLEISESAPLGALAGRCVSELRKRGVQIAIDDLGAGYSNLRYIADLAPEFVKLDSKMIGGLAESERHRILVRHLVGMVEELGAKVIAEGVERPDDLELLRDLGCHFAQGFVIARPSNPPAALTG